jgi:hypothetical protein
MGREILLSEKDKTLQSSQQKNFTEDFNEYWVKDFIF